MSESTTLETTATNKLVGTNLRSRDFRTGGVFFEVAKPKLEYAWDTGKAIGKFLTELKKGKIVGTYCAQCKRTLVPPRMFCELCFKDIDKWVPLKDTGVIQTFSVCFITWDMKRVKNPQIPAVITIDTVHPPEAGSLDKTTPGGWRGGGFMHLVKVKDWKSLKIGDRVKAVWKPKAQRKGAITDIKYFEVIK